MKYLCLAYEAEQDLKSLSREEWLALRQETLDYVAALRERGELLDTQALQSPTRARVARVRDGGAVGAGADGCWGGGVRVSVMTVLLSAWRR